MESEIRERRVSKVYVCRVEGEFPRSEVMQIVCVETAFLYKKATCESYRGSSLIKSILMTFINKKKKKESFPLFSHSHKVSYKGINATEVGTTKNLGITCSEIYLISMVPVCTY